MLNDIEDGKEVVWVDGISLDKEQSDEHTVTFEKVPTLETVVLLHKKYNTITNHSINKLGKEKGIKYVGN